MALKSVFSTSSPISVQEQNEETGTVFIKGFASVATVDRGGDIVPPEEFRVAQFLTSPTILVNHDFWIDKQGNPVSVGVAREAYPAEVRDSDDPDMYAVVSFDGQYTNTIRKADFPELYVGATGLFVVVEVSEPDIVAKVRDRKLTAFSWRGLVRVEQSYAENGVRLRTLRDIDLHEISLVDIPQNQRATFVIGKSEDGIEALVQSIVFSKSVFQSQGMVREYLEAKDYDFSDIRESDTEFVAVQAEIGQFEADTMSSLKMSPGVSVIAGQVADQAEEQKNAFTPVPDFKERLAKFINCEVPKMPTTSSTPSKVTLEGQNIEVRVGTDLKDVPASEVEKSVVKPTVSREEVTVTGNKDLGGPDSFQLLTNKEELFKYVDEAIAKRTDAISESVTKGMTALGEVVQKLADAQAAAVAEPTAGETTAEASEDTVEAPAETPAETAVETPVETPAEPASTTEVLLKKLNEMEANLNGQIRVIAEHVDEQEQRQNSVITELQKKIEADSIGVVVDPSYRRETVISKSNSVPKTPAGKRSAVAASLFGPVV